MNFNTQRNTFLIFWFTAFLGSISIILYLYLDKWIEKDNFILSMKTINTLYAPYLGTIALFYFGKKGDQISDLQPTSNSRVQFYLALVFSIVWNFFILVFLLPLLFQKGNIEESIENIQNISSIFSWLVAAAIGYYFGNVTKT